MRRAVHAAAAVADAAVAAASAAAVVGAAAAPLQKARNFFHPRTKPTTGVPNWFWE